MALTQVRAKLGEEWVVLTYNEATGRYEGQLTPSGTSYHQPGGYFPVAVEATNDSGDTATATAETMASLRLVVRETTAPALTLVSPAPGYLQTGAPTFVFEAVDEEGGSGVDPESFEVSAAAETILSQASPAGSFGKGALSAAAETEEIPGGYRFTWSPPGGWADGQHTVTASVQDYDGNLSTVSGAYTVDTVPPALYLKKPYLRHVVDEPSVSVAVEAWDGGSGIASVIIGGINVGAAQGGRPQTADVPLDVGENHIQIVATDAAGNQTTQELYMIRLVTDRTKADMDVIRALWKKPVQTWTEEEQAAWAGAVQRGSWTAETLNRVGIAVDFLAGELEKRGYMPSVQSKTDWTMQDAPTLPQMTTYLQNVETVRSAQGVYIPDIPGTLRMASHEAFNAVEKALVETDAVFPHYFAWTSGEITCGGV